MKSTAALRICDGSFDGGKNMLLKDKTVLLGVTGSIAAYKSASLASALVKEGADVHVLMTKNAANFIAPMTFETLTHNKCLIDTFDRFFSYEVEHVSLGEKADCMILAPASADVIAKLACGIADDMLTTTALACTAPILVAPAMNTHMLEKKVTQENIARLKELGMKIIEPAVGRLACGTSGAGKMPEPEQLLEEVLLCCSDEKLLAGRRVLVTAGPTQEAVDPVRFLSNHSSGKMGYAVARAAARCGADVTLVSGPTALLDPVGVRTYRVISAAEMAQKVFSEAPESDIIIKAAAVADFCPAHPSDEKIKKSSPKASLDAIELTRTTDILAALGAEKKAGQFLCGFSMETSDLLEHSREKLRAKNLDLLAANSLRVDGAGFACDTNVLTLIAPDGERELPKMSKDEAARELIHEIARRME